jgi:hypothetical protein
MADPGGRIPAALPFRLMGRSPRRLERERRTVESMIDLYCRDVHGTDDALCPACAELAAYARKRLEKCPFGEDKPTCADCPIHCYRPAIREQMQQVMRHSGPRMLLRHPYLAIRHMLDSRREAPQKPPRRAG